MNLINHIGNQVTVWTKEGNALENRTLITADEMGVVVSSYEQDREVFIPWCRVKYVDLIKPMTVLKPPSPPSPEFIEKAKEIIERAKNGEFNKWPACKYCGQPVEPMKDDLLHSEGISMTRDEAWHDFCENHRIIAEDTDPETSVSALVRTLEEQENVRSFYAGVNAEWKLIIDYAGKHDIAHNGHGPAQILVVTD